MEKFIIKPTCNVYKIPDKKSTLETQFLFGEEIQIIEHKKNWCLCKNMSDKYIGWINEESIGYLPVPTHKVKNINTLVFTKPNIKSKKILILPFNSKISVKSYDREWSKIILKQNGVNGFIFNKHISKIKSYSNNIIEIINSFKNTPYLWGGKSYLGIDCSGLIQVVLQSYGINFPRNSKDQMKYLKKNVLNCNYLKGIYLIFWKGHVAFQTSKNFIIHSSAHDLKVVRENIMIANKRFKKQNLIVLSRFKL